MSISKNSRRDSFLNNIPCVSIDDVKNDLTNRCKFNFSYMDFSQPAGQRFEAWTQMELAKLLNKVYNLLITDIKCLH